MKVLNIIQIRWSSELTLSVCVVAQRRVEKKQVHYYFLIHQKFHVSSLPGDVGYRVQCSECGTEQHAECVKYDIKDPYR